MPGAYVGFPDKVPFGAFMNKGLTMKSGQTHMQRYLAPLLEKIESAEIDPSFVITHEVAQLPRQEASSVAHEIEHEPAAPIAGSESR